MDNLTFAQRIIRPHTIDPLEGHTVVVFETIGTSGDEFRFEIGPGQRLPKTRLDLFGWLRGRRSDEKYFAYAVNGAPRLRETFSANVPMDIQAHSFALIIDLAYSVASPRLVVVWRNEDPFKKVRDEISVRLAREFSKQNWARVRDDFRELEREILNETFDSLSLFAEEYGLRIHEIALSHSLSPEDFEEIKRVEAAETAKAEAAREEELKRAKLEEEERTRLHQEAIKRKQLSDEAQTASQEEELRRKRLENESKTMEVTDDIGHSRRLLQAARDSELQTKTDTLRIGRLENETRLANHERLQALANAGTRAVAKALELVGGSIDGSPELVQTIGAIHSALIQLRDFGTLDAEPRSLPAGTSAGRLSAYQGGAASILQELFSRTEQPAFNRDQRRKIQSAALIIVGELLLGEDEVRVAEQQKLLENIRAEIKLPVADADYFRTFLDTAGLRVQLQ